ncbi:hypothetical protein PENSPDRAFT_753782 [Peniophora sp. CONT]|nr:hypothetical protein PENSPDRAFT_753782 [Peniophora sp. CONT]
MEPMDNRAFKNLLCDGPHTGLLEAIDGGQDHRVLRSLLDDELRRSASRLQRLKEYRNAITSPMYRLHPEILSNILYIYAKDNNELFDLRWTRLLFVCRRWHDIAMRTLSLWSFIDIGIAEESIYAVSHSKNECDARDVRRIEMQRSRAAFSPLTIRMSLYSMLSETKLAYASMYWNPSSLRSLTLNGEDFYVDKVVRVLASHQHATLETLELHCFDHGKSWQRPAPFLACIDTIIIQAASEVCTHLFEALSLPSTAKILTSTTATVDGSPVSALASFMGGHAARDGAPVIRSITMAFTLSPPMMDEDNGIVLAPATSRLGIVGQMIPKRLGRGAVSRWFYAWPPFSYLPYITFETTTPVSDEVRLLKSTLQCWPLAGVTHIDMRMADFDLGHLGVMLAELPGATTVVLRPRNP